MKGKIRQGFLPSHQACKNDVIRAAIKLVCLKATLFKEKVTQTDKISSNYYLEKLFYENIQENV